MFRKKMIFMVVGLVVMLTSVSFKLVDLADTRQRDYYYEVKANQKLFGMIYEEISMRYVEEINPEKFIRAGINAMLGELDPYTVYIDEEDNVELQIMTQGKYGGLGLRIIQRDGYPTVIEPPTNDSPAEKAGIREGDQIIQIDGKSSRNMSVSDAAKLMRGEPGTKVTISIKRAGEAEPIEFRLIRAIIEVRDITYKNIIDAGIGYIQLTHFSKDAGKEINQAINELKSQGMQSLILDLRGNPGGLLEAAVEVTENFLKKGELIVSTKGRITSANQNFVAQGDPTWDTGALIVLVDGATASAAEITSGAIQDLDRGVVIGTQTFGKGLVQTVVHLDKDADLKLTTAKYYIPSGRLIQKQNYFQSGRAQIWQNSSDSLDLTSASEDTTAPKPTVHKMFKTRNGRIVYEGGGITPDVTIPAAEYNRYQLALVQKSMLFGFAVQFHGKHPELKSNFEVTPEIWQEFRQYLKEKNFEYQPAGLSYLEKFKATLRKEGEDPEIKFHLDAIQKIMEKSKQQAFEANLDFIKRSLKTEIAAKIAGNRGKLMANFQNDPVLLKAVALFKNPEQYSVILRNHGAKL
ncbi:S41 family peptidase [candidate division KSB1 bacterium]|nr:S41 family peptidase [candidate division KSB1 bacterium]